MANEKKAMESLVAKSKEIVVSLPDDSAALENERTSGSSALSSSSSSLVSIILFQCCDTHRLYFLKTVARDCVFS